MEHSLNFNLKNGGNMKLFKKISISIIHLIFIFASINISAATNTQQILLKAEMVNPYLLEGQSHKTYLKVGLTGFDLPQIKDRTPVNVAIVLDRSGSMQGEKIRKARQAATLAVNQLNRNDIVSIVTYSDTVSVLLPATKVTDKHQINALIQRIYAGGSTALFAGVVKGASEVRKFLDRNRVNRVILISDGIANVGPSSPSALGNLGASLGKEGISVTTIGLGSGYNEDLMTKLAMYSDGNHAFAETPQDLAKIFDHEFNDILSVVAQDVTIKITCDKKIRPIRVLGREAEIMGQDIMLDFNQIYSNQEKYILLEVDIPKEYTTKPRSIAKVQLSYDNMLTKRKNSQQTGVSVKFTRSEKTVKSNINRKVAINKAEQIATEVNKQALKLRDSGKVKEAKDVLLKNSQYLQEQAEELDADELQGISDLNIDDAENLEGSKWQIRRKVMKKKQYESINQQSY